MVEGKSRKNVGIGNGSEAGPSKPDNRCKKEAKIETRGPKTGEVSRSNVDGNSLKPRLIHVASDELWSSNFP
ncbi:hypothetical protein CROQUDRAFT_87817 [Cronartium quercuum f. sp. fusiforme G11]|uniref:Uncharacterized protein n=1 Tax=Cronartium quercuum f. sp. fusiforme G11 TaxID=708437 RepID=A0A9P6TFP7_9BASI|nr:hypothetical protein CROQUDRAFT_87817 [Cronartium quercuum f. sp. fusiforme G11]